MDPNDPLLIVIAKMETSYGNVNYNYYSESEDDSIDTPKFIFDNSKSDASTEQSDDDNDNMRLV